MRLLTRVSHKKYGMNRQALVDQIRRKGSYLCVGLDTDLQRIPAHLLREPDPIFSFNKAIIDATYDLCVAYKPNLAFYECLGPKGWESLAKTIDYIPEELFVIADAKRGDIGNTSTYYAQTFFETYGFDALTIAPYMGRDSVEPFLKFEDKWVILLGLTSNAGSSDFQQLQLENGAPLYTEVLTKARQWGSPEALMFVVGATHPDKILEVRQYAPDNFLLVPGVGAQGGDLEGISRNGFTKDVGLLVNSSRGIIYAGNGAGFASQARAAAEQLQAEMAQLMDRYLPDN